MKVYKLVVMVIDHDAVESVKNELENGRYANRCISPRVMSEESVDIGEWEDDNPLNFHNKQAEEFERLFPELARIRAIEAAALALVTADCITGELFAELEKALGVKP